MKLIDLTGRQFGKLTVIERAITKNNGTYWLCKCECGNTKIVEAYRLKNNKCYSCGCSRRPNPRKINMVGKRFGMLTVIKEAENPYGIKKAAWECKCDCGKSIVAIGDLLRRGYYSSCGCQKAKRMHDVAFKHGKSNTRLFKIWSCMKQRCYYPGYTDYHCYGGRGIKVCEEWLADFQNFYIWAINSGYKSNLSIDRIDVNGDYSPDNCRWATPKEQANNKTTNHLLTYNGETHTTRMGRYKEVKLWLPKIKDK